MASDEDHESGWQTMESDPGVFTELLKSLGVSSLIVDDLYSLDADSIAAIKPVHAFIFLFKWVGGGDEKGGADGAYDDEFGGFFANQVVNNACATIAVMNGICNIPDLKVGPELEQLKEFASALDSQTCGEVITSDAFFRTAHNSLSPPPSISLSDLTDPADKKSGDAYHFIVYAPVNGHIYEFDGLKRAPVKHGAYVEGGEGWTGKAREVVEKRIGTYPPESLHFNLLALRDDPLPALQTKITEAQSKNQNDYASTLLQQVAIENEKRGRWTFENSLRRHNHLGTIHALLQALASANLLDPAISNAKSKMQERVKEARKGKGGGDIEIE